MHSTHRGWGWAAVAALMLATLAVAAASAAQTAPAAPDLRPAPDEIQSFVRAALEDRLAAHNLPDGGLLRDNTRIAIRAEMPQSRLRLTDRALPQQPGRELQLITLAVAQAEADRTRQSLVFVTVDLPKLTDDSATVWIGVDIAVPTDPRTVKLCCCSAEASFQHVGDRWTFMKWSQEICS